MIDILYYIFIFPLESVLGVVLDSLHLLTKNYGLSIVILSLLVNLFLLKLAKIAESKATKINTLKSTCDSKITEFKRVFKGAELQSYIRTLYKQKHYHPIFALSALGGLALQVPFFIAVLCLLQEFNEIRGVSFLWISDLSLPDSVFGIHLLPILMTIISLINVWIVAKEKSALIQGGLISLIFLVLLYAMPSALVLYWSTNMAFSLIRALCGNSLLGMRFRRIAKSPQGTDTKSAILVSIRQKLQKPHCNNFDCVKGEYKSDLSLRESATFDKVVDSWQSAGFVSEAKQPSKNSPSLAEGVRGWVNSTQCTKSHNNKTNFFIHPKPIKIAVITLTSILALGLCITFALMLYAKDNVQTAPITLDSYDSARIHFGKWDFLLRSSSISNVKLVRVEWDSAIDSNNIKVVSNAKRHLNFKTTRILGLDKGTNLGQIFYKMDFMPLLKNLFKYYFDILGAILGIYLLLCIIERFQRYEPQNAKIYRQISIYAIVCIAFLICVFTPYQLYSTDITQFDSTQTYATLSALFGAFALISFMVIYVFSFVPKRFSNIIAFALSVVLFSGIVYSFILVGDYGAMDRFILQKAPEKSTGQIFEFIAVLLLGIALMTFALKKLKIAMQIILATLFIVSGVNALQIVNKRLDSDKIDQQSKINDKSEPPYADSPLFSYSKNDKNIVVIVLDMFSGSHTPYILEQFPEFKTQLDGFTLFPNAISSSNATLYSMPSIIGGEHYTIYNMNKRKDNHAKSEANAYKSIGLSFANAGYSASYLMYAIEAREKLLNESKITWIDNTEIFKAHFLEQHPEIAEQLQNEHYDIVKLISFGVFKFVPNAYRAKIYNDGLWLQDIRKVDKGTVISHLATFYATTHIGNTNATKPTFKFIHTSMTHAPYGIYLNNGQCEYLSDKTIWENANPHISAMEYGKYSYQHFDTELCALTYLAHYIQWLKNEGIYDNTQILIVSDHAGDDSINTPKLSPRTIGADTIFLFKDFKERGNLKIDSRLMANYDIASIFCANLKGCCENVPKNILQNYPANREIIHARPDDDFNRHKPNLWLIDRAYKVKDNIYDEKNWTDISDEKYGIVNVK